MMMMQLLWVIFKMPETKGVPLEQLEAKLLKKIPADQNKPVSTIKTRLEIK
jgi:hypothetical protein